jgi:3-oxoacyl-[acyl-carrier protein] reductase
MQAGLRFAGKNAVVTGGATGIGLAAAKRLAAEGASVFLTGRREVKLSEAVDNIRQELGQPAHAFAADVSKTEDVRAMVEQAARLFDGKIDVLVNSAGLSSRVPFLEETEEHWNTVLDINLKGTFFVSQAVARLMTKTGGGSIVNVSSTSGIVGENETNLSIYCASKGGVSLLTKQMAIELAPYGIRVNAVCPGWTLTPLTEGFLSNTQKISRYLEEKVPLRRVAMPEEMAAVIAFLASGDASYITGEQIVADGGQLAY